MPKPTDTFIDEVTVSVSAGAGGEGCVSFRREKFEPRGGPDGGDGGRGGNVVLVADRNLATLLDHRVRPEVRAPRGEPGKGTNKHGKAGEHVVLRVPVGTMVYDADAGEDAAALADLSEPDARLVAARGGRGGRGNANFATPTRQAPDFATPAKPGESRRLRLELKLLADVGLMGFPNAGKSTLIRRLSAARPRVGAYPFTTLVPSLGVVEVDDRRFVVADIPGLIEGAHEGAGLGDRFLRHIQRTRVLLHLVDAGVGPEQAVDDWRTIRAELEASGHGLDGRPCVVAASKTDVASDPAAVGRALEAAGAGTVSLFSSATGEGLAALLGRLRLLLAELAEAGGKPPRQDPSKP